MKGAKVKTTEKTIVVGTRAQPLRVKKEEIFVQQPSAKKRKIVVSKKAEEPPKRVKSIAFYQ
jgi:hypothetical protein